MQGTRADALNVAGENCKIVNCTVKNAAECGINVSGRNNLVENCEVAFIGKDAVVLSGGSETVYLKQGDEVELDFLKIIIKRSGLN